MEFSIVHVPLFYLADLAELSSNSGVEIDPSSMGTLYVLHISMMMIGAC